MTTPTLEDRVFETLTERAGLDDETANWAMFSVADEHRFTHDAWVVAAVAVEVRRLREAAQRELHHADVLDRQLHNSIKDKPEVKLVANGGSDAPRS